MTPTYSATLEEFYWFVVPDDGILPEPSNDRRWSCSVYRTVNGETVCVWRKEYRRKSAAKRAAKVYPDRFSSYYSRMGRCWSERRKKNPGGF